MRNNFVDPKWEVVSEVDDESRRKKALAKAHRLRGVYFVVAGVLLIAFAMVLAGMINWFAERLAESNGNSHYSELLPSGAVLCGVISIFKGVFKSYLGNEFLDPTLRNKAGFISVIIYPERAAFFLRL